MLDKLDHQRTRAKNIKQRLKALEEEKLKFEQDLMEADTLSKSLEEEQASLCYIVGPDGQAEETEEEEDDEDEVLNEEQTATMMKKLNPGYLSKMFQAEIEKQKAADRNGRESAAGAALEGDGMDS